MLLKRGQIPTLIFTLIYLVIFSIIFFSRKNYEFIAYVGVIAFFFILILLTNKKVNYSTKILWGLSLWGLLHMAGGGINVNGEILYKLILIPISQFYGVFRYDQFVHIFGFGVATLLSYALLKPLLKPNLSKWTSLSIIVVMAGLGIGALNEIVEFIVTVLIPETNVGGYINTSLDLVSDLVGAVLALIYIRIRKGAN